SSACGFSDLPRVARRFRGSRRVSTGAILMVSALDKRPPTRQPPQSIRGPIGFIGAGKVGTALAALLHAGGVRAVAVSGPTLDDSRRMAISAGLSSRVASDRAGTITNADLVFLTVPDDDIG